MLRHLVGPHLQRLDPDRGMAIKLVVAHTCGSEQTLKLGKLCIEVVDSPCAVWKADHVVVVVCHGLILVVPELTPECASNDSHSPSCSA